MNIQLIQEQKQIMNIKITFTKVKKIILELWKTMRSENL